MAVGRISGPLLKDNLLRNGVNLAFETNLLYLDVVNSRVGINTSTPSTALQVNGTTRTTNLTATTANLATFTISGNTIASSNATINLIPSGANAVVYQGTISVGLLNISGNTIQATGTNTSVNVTATGTGGINLNNNTTVTGNLHATGNITADGNIQLGDAVTDTITFNAEVASSILPSVTNTYDLGSNSLKWANVYATTVTATTVTAPNFTGSLTVTGASNLTGNTTIGATSADLLTVNSSIITDLIPNVTATYNLGSTSKYWNNTYASTLLTSGLSFNGNVITSTATNGNLQLTANGTGSVLIQNIGFNNNVISSTGANADITLTPQGTGSVIINNTQSFIVPVGTTAQQPATPVNGMVRYNTTNSRYEGRSNGYWTNLGGVQNVSGSTRILPETSPGAGNNVIDFYANNIKTAYIDSTKLYTIDFQTSGIDISTNTISAIATDTDLNLNTTGNGTVAIGSLRFANSTISNAVADSITQFTEVGTGYVKVAGTNGMVIPVGANSNRPGSGELGMVRYNSDLQYVEMYVGGTGTGWQNVAGPNAGVTLTDATELAIALAISLG